MPDVSGLTRQLAAYLAGVRAQPLPLAVQERTKLHLLDTLAAIVSGATLDAGQRAIDYIRQEGSAADASVIGGGITGFASGWLSPGLWDRRCSAGHR